LRRSSFIALLLYLVVVWMLILTTATNAEQQPAPANAGSPLSSPGPLGWWLTPNHHAVIQIAQCGPDVCGQIAGIKRGQTDPIPRDWAGQSQCHLTIIRVRPSADRTGQTEWTGTILDPRDGSAYHAIITLDASHHLQLRGYVGLPIFGRTQTWTPYGGQTTPDCRLE
jgi:uncharacterized protein (DUF2147 family)